MCEECERLTKENLKLRAALEDVQNAGTNFSPIPVDWDHNKFWAKVNIQGENDCWRWRGSFNGHGYGSFSMVWAFDGGVCGYKNRPAHRVAYAITHGDTSKPLRHLCNNPWCVNPKHLKPGTYQENGQDLADSGKKKGENHHRNSVSVNTVRLIRGLEKRGLTEACAPSCGRNPDLGPGVFTFSQIGSMFCTTRNNVRNIVTRMSWDYTSENASKFKAKKKISLAKRVAANLKAKELQEKYESGKARLIAAGVSVSVIAEIEKEDENG